MSRRAVVFGAAGQLGTELVRELQQRRFTVMAWDRSQVDITDPVAVQDALANCDAEVVFNAAASTSSSPISRMIAARCAMWPLMRSR